MGKKTLREENVSDVQNETSSFTQNDMKNWVTYISVLCVVGLLRYRLNLTTYKQNELRPKLLLLIAFMTTNLGNYRIFSKQKNIIQFLLTCWNTVHSWIA